MHESEVNVRFTLGNVPSTSSRTSRRCTVAALISCHCWQATSQAQHFTQRLESTKNPYCSAMIYPSHLLIFTRVCLAIAEWKSSKFSMVAS